jgi:hypothetical protein
MTLHDEERGDRHMRVTDRLYDLDAVLEAIVRQARKQLAGDRVLPRHAGFDVRMDGFRARTAVDRGGAGQRRDDGGAHSARADARAGRRHRYPVRDRQRRGRARQAARRRSRRRPEIMNWPAVPPMFTLRDPDGNTVYLVGRS